MTRYWRSFVYDWDQFLGAEPLWGPVMLVVVISTLVAVAIAVEAGPRATSTRRRVLALAPAGLLTLISLASLLWLVGHAREHDLSAIIASEWRGRFLVPEHEWLRLLAPIVVLAVPALLLAIARTFRCEIASRCALIALAAGMAAPATSLVYTLRVSWFNVDAIRAELRMFSLCLDCGIASIVIIGVVVGVFGARRYSRRIGSRSLVPVLVFVAGASSFIVTRDHAADRHHLVSLVGDHGTMLMHPIKSFPIAPKWLNACSEVPNAPVVAIGRGRMAEVWLDGVRVDQNGMRLALELTTRNWSILHPAERFPGQLILSVDRSRTMTELQPWLDTFSLAGYWTVLVTFEDLRQVHTGTLGTLVTRHHCAVEFFLSPCFETRTGTIESVLLEGAKRSPLWGAGESVGVAFDDGGRGPQCCGG